jgi:ABC-type transport system substrate-binding protein
MAHEIDVVPETASIYRDQFTGVSSVRALETPAKDTAALYFNVRASSLDSVDTRRRIAGAIHREAIAQLACGNANCASPPVEAHDTGNLPARLELLVIDDLTTLGTAAKVLRHQLWPLGIEIIIQPVTTTTIVERMTAGRFDLALLPLSLGDHRFGFFLSPGHPKGLPMTGYANVEYDAAVDRGDLAAAQAILDRDVPVTRLFENRYFAAVDGRFCGDVTPTVGSWLWLSKLYPCEEGPPP